MSYYYLSHKTIRYMVKDAKPKASFLDVLTWMCRATEYDELPVRHNEDLINAELSRNLTFPGTSFGLPMWDPHVKAFLLLQAHMSRITLPITDYVGDQTSVLDQAIRIIQASIDVLAELGYLSSALEMIHLLQSVKSARWPTESPVSILPGVDPEKTQDKTTLQKLSAMNQGQMTKLVKDLHIPASQQQRFLKTAAIIPNVNVAVENVTALSLNVVLKRLNPVVERDARMYAPKFPKPQSEGWFVVVGDLAKDEVYAVKRLGWSQGQGKSVGVGSRPSARAAIKLPDPGEGRRIGKVDILVLSDGYIGLQYQMLGVEIPGLPTVDDDLDKSKGGAGGAEVANREAGGS